MSVGSVVVVGVSAGGAKVIFFGGAGVTSTSGLVTCVTGVEVISTLGEVSAGEVTGNSSEGETGVKSSSDTGVVLISHSGEVGASVSDVTVTLVSGGAVGVVSNTVGESSVSVTTVSVGGRLIEVSGEIMTVSGGRIKEVVISVGGVGVIRTSSVATVG